MIYGRIHGLTGRTATDIDDVVVGALRAPVLIIILVTGGLILSRILPLSAEWDRGLSLGVKIAVILAGVLFVDALVKGLLWRYSRKADYLRTSSGIVQTAVRGVIILVALLIVLDTAGVSVTPLIASLGVGSLAVALALQSPLENGADLFWVLPEVKASQQARSTLSACGILRQFSDALFSRPFST